MLNEAILTRLSQLNVQASPVSPPQPAAQTPATDQPGQTLDFEYDQQLSELPLGSEVENRSENTGCENRPSMRSGPMASTG